MQNRGFSLVERGVFDPAHISEVAVYTAWLALCATFYGVIATRHKLGEIYRQHLCKVAQCNSLDTLTTLLLNAARQDYGLLLLGLVMPPYALRYVFFGTRWGSNSSFAMVNTLFTSLCPANILLPCPDIDPVNCQLSFPKVHMQQQVVAPAQCPWASARSPHLSNHSQQQQSQPQQCAGFMYNSSASDFPSDSTKLSRQHLQFPVLVPLWRIYVKERPLPIYLHTSFMTIASLLWPLLVLLACCKTTCYSQITTPCTLMLVQ